MTAPAMVRNTAAGPTVFSEGPNATVEWAGANDPMGGDLQPVPESFLNNVQFHRMAARGILVVETADEAIQAGQFIAEESDRIVNGKPEIVWLKTNLGATTRQD
jgi:hypothetical protein